MADMDIERHGSSNNVKIEVVPQVCLHDVPTSIKVTGLTNDCSVTLTLTTHNDKGKRFHTFAHYVSDANGMVDVEHSEALGGAFKGVFPAGLFLSLQDYPFQYTRLQKEDPTTPWKMKLLAHEGHLTLEQSASSNGLASVELERHTMAPGVRREPVVHERVRGTVFFPAGPGPYPAVIDISGGFGGLKEYRASMMASRGFACLVIAYVRYDDLPKTLTTLELEYFDDAVKYLLKQPSVIPDRCGVLSSSLGSNIGLAMGIYLPKVTAVVSIGGIIGVTDMTYNGRVLWKGMKLDKTGFQVDENNIVIMNNMSKILKKMLTYDHPSMPPCETAPDDTHFLVISGEDDTIPSMLMLEAMVERMRLHGREKQCHVVTYPGAGHIIEPPYDTYASHSIHDLTGKTIIMKWGGEPWGTCKAQEDNWHNMRKFMKMHVQDRSPWYQEFIGKVQRERNH